MIIDASAEPSVLAGINGGTRNIINNNLTGTINCLDYALLNNAKFIFLSTVSTAGNFIEFFSDFEI